MKKKLLQSRAKTLLPFAVRAQKKAYAPYSKFKVGAAVLDSKGRIFSGCNVENVSNPCSTCAERSAIGAMINRGSLEIAEVVIVTDVAEGIAPCGFCRQVILEFSKNPHEVLIHLANKKQIVKTMTIAELLPLGFDYRNLKCIERSRTK